MLRRIKQLLLRVWPMMEGRACPGDTNFPRRRIRTSPKKLPQGWILPLPKLLSTWFRIILPQEQSGKSMLGRSPLPPKIEFTATNSPFLARKIFQTRSVRYPRNRAQDWTWTPAFTLKWTKNRIKPVRIRSFTTHCQQQRKISRNCLKLL
jgi:hypothetical protein